MGVGGWLTMKRQQEASWETDGDTLYLDCGGVYTTGCLSSFPELCAKTSGFYYMQIIS